MKQCDSERIVLGTLMRCDQPLGHENQHGHNGVFVWDTSSAPADLHAYTVRLKCECHQLFGGHGCRYCAAADFIEDQALLLMSAENRWKLAMRRLHERFGDGLAVHKADIEALLEKLSSEDA